MKEPIAVNEYYEIYIDRYKNRAYMTFRGFWKDLDGIEGLRLVDRSFSPGMDPREVESLYFGWKQAVKRVQLN